MDELVYAGRDTEEVVRKRYPQAKIKDASDYIHTERFELELPEVTEEEFYPFALREGFARCCLSFELHFESLRFPEPEDQPGKHKETEALIRKWCDLAKEMV